MGVMDIDGPLSVDGAGLLRRIGRDWLRGTVWLLCPRLVAAESSCFDRMGADRWGYVVVVAMAW